MRTFQYSDAKSHKFWNIEVSGTSFTVTYGKVGSSGQTQPKTFASAEEAQAEADKLIQEKLKKGYVETTPKRPASQAEAFEDAIRANPHDLATVCAFADYLADHGDPRGEFMQVQIALENESISAAERQKLHAREMQLLDEHEQDWVGDWPDLFDAPTETEGRGQINHTGGRKYQFNRGMLTTINFGQLTVAAARAFVKAPQTRLVHELFIGYYQYEEEFEPGPDIPTDLVRGDDSAAEYVILRWPYFRNVRRFQFGWMSDEVYGGDFCNFQCHLGGDHLFDFVKQMPDVEEVLVFAHFREADKLVALPMPNLRVLQLYHGWSYPLETLAKNSTLTNLTHLLCHPHALEHGDDPYIGLPQLQAVCRSPHLPKLTHLRLRLTDFGDRGAEEIVQSGILKRLKVLDLRHGCMTDEGAQLLAGCPDLHNLERLDLSRNALTEAGMDVLRATKVPVELDYQHGSPSEEDELEEEDQYLYDGDYE
jgi:uncharacterized protein (TIGR02996 family)